jgi:hypothetical protein
MPSEKFRNAKTPVASYTVPLLDLPTELFQSIIHKIVGSITLVKAMKHRRVCSMTESPSLASKSNTM